LDEVTKLALVAAAELSPILRIMSAATTEEVLKYLCRCYSPLQQWLFFDARECVADNVTLYRVPRNRYYSQACTIGPFAQEKLMQYKCFMVR